MDTFLKAAALILITVIIGMAIPKNAKELLVLLILAACTSVIIILCGFLEQVIRTVQDIIQIGKLDGSFLEIMLKATCVAILAEFVTLICNDSGYTALGKSMQLLGSIVILWLSLPLFSTLLDIIKNVLTLT